MSDDPAPLQFTGPLTPSAFTFVGQGRKFLTITHDGRIEIGDGFEPDEAGRKAIEGMRYQLNFIIQAAVEAEREACALVAEQFKASPWRRSGEFAQHVSTAIRKRTQVT